MYGLEGKRVIITGGAAGIGNAIAKRFAQEGCDIGILDWCADRAQQVVAELSALRVRARFEKADVSDFASVQQAVAAIRKDLGQIDILVNDAAIHTVSLLVEMPVADWEQMFKINVHGVFNCCKCVLPEMMERKRGRVINIASWKGKRGTPYTGAYCATKSAVIIYTEALAQEMGPYHVTVNAICPGMVRDTNMMNDWQATARKLGLPTMEDRLPSMPLGRPATVGDIANLAAFLASEEAAYITGEAWNVTGGMWMS
jgi:NAD(P)-dependent dehydrogenase (short-subunit alcohol dehydrogenase family)